MTIRTGDRLVLIFKGQRVDARVELASGNEASLMLTFDAIIGGHVGSMPLLRDPDGIYRTLTTREAVELKL